jgi:hypothetical protein
MALSHGGIFPGKTTQHARPVTWDELCYRISRLPRDQIWRHNTAGDLPGIGDVIDLKLLDQLVQANKRAHARGYTYSHKPVGYNGQRLINAQAIYAANKQGFVISLSADSLQQADEYYDMGIAPVVVVVPSTSPRNQSTPKGRLVISCPAEKEDEDGCPIIQCDRCQLCAKNHKAIVAFHAHGRRKKAVDLKLRAM